MEKYHQRWRQHRPTNLYTAYTAYINIAKYMPTFVALWQERFKNKAHNGCGSFIELEQG